MSELIGQNLGPYRIVEQLGLGGMATVYKAYQPSMDRYVAIKVLPRHFAHDPTFVGRFEQEAKVIAKLEHARILPVFDYGEQDGITYIVMRYLNAGTLTDRIQEGPMDLEEVARIVSAIGEGLDYAHKRGVIHRDIKPSNIMLDDSGDAYITDFGISKLVEGTAQFTGSGIVGTPAYLSPEQGLGQPVDHRTDIYSLGVMLYQMVTGHVPFQAETPMAVVIKHINEPLPLPHLMNPEVPEHVEAVILKAMAKDPDARYMTAGELAKALQKAVADARAGAPAPRAVTEQAVKTTPTPVAAIGAPATLPVARPAAAEEAKSGTAAPAVTSPLPEPTAPPKKRLSLVTIGAIVVGLCICGVLALVVLNALSKAGEEQAGTTGGTDSGGEVVATEPSEPTVPPDQLAQATSDVAAEGAAAPLPGRCPPDMQPVSLLDFEAAEVNTGFGENVEIRALENGQHVLALLPGDGEASHYFGQPMKDSSLGVDILYPEGPANLGIISRAGDAVYYAAFFTADGQVVLMKGEAPISEPAALPPIFDGEVHHLEVQTVGQQITAVVDGQIVAQAQDSEPLPAGAFGTIVTGGVVYIDSFALCSPQNGRGNVILADEFEGSTLAPGWQWAQEPPAGSWAVENGTLRIDLLPGGNLGDAQGVTALGVPVSAITNFEITVFVDVHPTQHRQGAGLFVISHDGTPLARLVRGFCAGADQPDCVGDAIYFTRWETTAQGATPVGTHVAAAGELGDVGMVGLRLVDDRGSMRAQYSLDGQTWHDVGELPLRNLRIGGFGLVAAGGPDSTETIPALFDNFLLTSAPLP